ncbi:hypothetical protein F0562_015926 [Nyssa sinensis]|uniref:Protein kinase domain-containing protein n=1 Tax=Nyssa sinensis TaxID=561372 RepID=A0A5J4ZLN3_9ASTE|nr:hypothetical protein F0562_015926 [Nyssa sinensis]
MPWPGLTALSTSSLHSPNTHLILLLIFHHLCLPFVHPISFNITRFDAGANNIYYDGDAVPFLGAVELINRDEFTCRVGHATFAQDVRLWDISTGKATDFLTHFTFTIDTHNATYYGNGLAFFLAPVGYSIPPNSGGGFLGLFNTTSNDAASNNQIVMVEFDSTVNDDWDPPTEHVGINNNSLSSSVHAIWNAGSQSGKKANVLITYNATTTNLSVFWTYDENPVYNGNSSLSLLIDLMKVLPEWVTIGFSAATGKFLEQNTIHSWDFSSNLDSKNPIKKEPGRKTFWIVIFVVCLFVLVLGVGVGLLVLKKKRTRSSPGPDINREIERGALPRRFSYQELHSATNGFADNRRLGRGGSGNVYKGFLIDLGCQVAVKRIFSGIEHAERIFINEVNVISRLMHINLVKFVGWCHEQDEFMLVYDYMSNGSLDTHLFGNRRTLSWDVRYNIALGLASALHYLHEFAVQCVLHRDIKSANVLLDTDFRTKLGDFGVAKLVDPQLRNTQTTGVVGTYGYLAPEYVHEGRPSRASDMFSFGIVALEIACGRRFYLDGGFHVPLQRWVWQLYLAGNILDATDGRLDSRYDADEMRCLMIVGLWCSSPSDTKRPSAGQVIQVLKSEAPLPELPPDFHNPVFHPNPPAGLIPIQVDSILPSITTSLNDGERCVFHRDIKSANVLLDTDFRNKLGDFVDPQLRNIQTTGVVGTYGYLGPEYVQEGRPSRTSDMFRFGIVALTIACGRRSYQDGGFHMPLQRWVWQLSLAGNILDAADGRLDSRHDAYEMRCLMIVGLWCSSPSDTRRL